eukprot:CAMPEP_0178553428 /NCGR_PEP_ID=MMETSP0697-20121206/7809_1 /TAXON_ID=265572 /ORGANISM="Extubocellulus spinifer, Strain CCMP396" /LENGTH=410 /DNA_ID=CAMNT_0020186339 /DNA_START=104 /DNA_END=1336 /DNA_ORIENTATION=+
MSGRLIILPKKSYAPWKPENVERVLRDERLERERVEREEAARLGSESVARIQLLKKKKSKAKGNVNNNEENNTKRNANEYEDDGSTRALFGESAAEMRHVNLFEREEKQMTERAVADRPVGGDRDGSNSNANKKSGVAMSPMYLGGEEAARRRLGDGKALPFYLRADTCRRRETDRESQSMCQEQAKDDRLKARMDPMHQFLTAKYDTTVAKKTRAVGERNNQSSPGKTSTTCEQDKIPIRDIEEGKGSIGPSRRRDRAKCTYGSDAGNGRASTSSMNNEETRRHRRSREKEGRRTHRQKQPGSPEASSKRRRKSSKRGHGGKSRRDEQRSSSERSSKERDDNVGNGGNNTEADAFTSSLSELRRRRELRERKEAERSFMLQLEQNSLAASHASTQRKYQDQYNPTLSRR